MKGYITNGQIDPLKKLPKKRTTYNIKKESIEQGKGVRLYDVDLAIAEHMIDTVFHTLRYFKKNKKYQLYMVILKDGNRYKKMDI